MKAKFLNLISFLEATEDADIFNSFKKMNTLNKLSNDEKLLNEIFSIFGHSAVSILLSELTVAIS